MEKWVKNFLKIMKIYKIAFNVSKDDLLASKLSREVFETVKTILVKIFIKK